MEVKMIQRFSIVLILLGCILVNGYSQDSVQKNKPVWETKQKIEKIKYKVTFIELGSVRCIPCQKMQPVMKSIKKKYAGQVNVVFHDVWTPEGKPFASIYGIESIPTQVFLDENGKEFSRHVGYFPEEDLINILLSKGVK